VTPTGPIRVCVHVHEAYARKDDQGACFDVTVKLDGDLDDALNAFGAVTTDRGLAADIAARPGDYRLVVENELVAGRPWLRDVCAGQCARLTITKIQNRLRGGGGGSEEEKRKLVKRLQAVTNCQDLVDDYYQYELEAMCKDLGVRGYTKDTSANALAQLLFNTYRPGREISSFFGVKTKPDPPRVSAAAKPEGRPTAKRQPSENTDTAVNGDGEAGGPYADATKRRCLAARTGSTSALTQVSSHARTHTCAPTRTHGRAPGARPKPK
jgi:hypothetical protein